jgi:hypothetical protein
VGAESIFGKPKNLNMSEAFKTKNDEGVQQWPNKDGEWHHSDVKVVAYSYVYQLYDNIVNNGGLQP